jgi:hypothetical protein
MNLLGNDTDVDSATLSVVALTAPLHGSAVRESRRDRDVHARPRTTSADSFTYRANDGSADSANVATVSVTITPVNDAPRGSGRFRDHRRKTPRSF